MLRSRCRPWAALVVMAVGLLTAACGSSATTALGPSTVKCGTTSASGAGMLPASGGSATLTITALPECTWTATTQASWIADLNPTSGQGNGQILFKVLANTVPSTRDADVIVNGQSVRVQQAAAPCTFGVTPASVDLSASGGTVHFVVSTIAGCPWSATSTTSWITVPGANGRSGPASLDVLIARNTGDERSAALNIAGQTVTVTQAALSETTPTATCTYTASPATGSIGAAGGPIVVGLATQPGCLWTVASADPWLEVTGAGSGDGSASITVIAGGNAGADRTGRITIGGQIVTVHQAAAAAAPGCAFSISPGGVTLQSTAATVVNVAVSSGSQCGWAAASQSPWIAVQDGASGAGNGVVTLAISGNTTSAARTGIVVIAGQSFSVNQPGGCSFGVSPTSASAPAAGGPGTPIAITTASGCSWTAVSGVPWVTITNGSAGSGNGTVTYGISANSGGARTGTLTVAGQIVTVSQGGGCTIGLTPESTSVSEAAGAGPAVAVRTSAECEWTAVPSANWITVTSGQSGTGNGTIRFSVAANPGPARSAAINVSGTAFGINQASGCAFSIAPASQSIGISGGAGTPIELTTAPGCTWSAATTANWLTITSPASSRSGTGSVTFTAAANTGAPRAGTLTIAGQTATISQAGSCTFVVDPAGFELRKDASEETVAVTAASGCAWTAVSNTSWISVISGETGDGNGTVKFRVTSNSGGTRRGSLTIAGQTIDVRQSPN